jgi:flavodoxin
MNISSATLVYFSPTQTTKKVVEGVARGVRVDTVEHLDLTPPQAKTRECEEMNDGLAIIGAPVYGGRIPGDVAHRLRRLKGNDTPAVVIVVYGNRAYGDALLELRDLVANRRRAARRERYRESGRVWEGDPGENGGDSQP